jgi:AP-2 complex subunit sigma-1
MISSQFLLTLFRLKVYSVVDEMFLAGEIRETSQIKVLKQLTTLTSLE